jgi:hypothetical protein
MAIEFAGDGKKDVTINKGNPAPRASAGGKSVIDFAGNGAMDVKYNGVRTKSGMGGKAPTGGPMQSPTETVK